MNKVNQQISKYIPAELQNLLDAASSSVSQILSHALFGHEVSEHDGAVLFSCRDNEKVKERMAIFAVADILRQRSKGDYVTFVVNRNINFIESDNLKKTETDTISVNPVYLASLAENLNLIDSYIYYVNLSEKFYSINEFDLYFLNNYIIDNEYLKNELIKLAFRAHLINL